MMVLQARNYLDPEGKITAITSQILRNTKINELLRNILLLLYYDIFLTWTEFHMICNDLLRNNLITIIKL